MTVSPTNDTATLMRDILDQDLLSTLLTGADGKNKHISSFTPAIFQTLQRDQFTTAESLDRIRVFQTKEDEELQARIAFIQYDQALETLKEAKKQVETSIEDANLNTWNSFRKMLVWDGFKESGDNFVKNTIVGATLWEDLYEKHTIKGYQYFKTEVKDFTADFAMPEGLDIEGLGFDGMQALLKKAMDTVPAEYKRIFGKQDKDGIYEGATYDKQSMKSETYTKQITRYDNVAQKYVDDTVEKTRMVRDTQGIKEDEYRDYLDELKALTDDQKSDKEYSSRVLVKNNGLFNEWVGTAPVMKKDADSDVSIEDYKRNVRYEGFGETDRLMGMFIQHKMIEGAGKAAANAPFYSKKLWNDNGSWFAAPSIRSVVDIAVTVAVAAAIGPGAIGLGPMLAGTGLNLIDDLVFTTLDVANGMDAGDAFGALGKKAMVSVVTSKIGNGFATKGGMLNSTMLGKGLIGRTMTKGLEITTTNIASSAINSLDFKAMFSGGDFFDQKGFMNGSFGKGAMTGVMSGMAGTFVGQGLSDMNTKTGSGFSFLAKNGAVDMNAVNSFNNTMSGLASTAVTYGMTGNASVNLLNAGMFGIKHGDTPVNVGLFELGFGKDGVRGSLSTGGTNMNLAQLYQSFKGFEQTNRIAELRNGGKTGNATLETLARLDYTSEADNRNLAKLLFKGTMDLELTDGVTDGPPEERKEYLGMYNRDTDTNTIKINRSLLDNTSEEGYAKLTSVVSHEGSHVFGNEIESIAYQQGGATYVELLQKLGISNQADMGFLGGIVKEIQNASNQTSNGGGDQLWTLTEDGRLIFDKRASLTIKNPDGTTKVISHKELGFDSDNAVEGSLVKILGLKSAEEARSIMANQMGLSHSAGNPADWDWNTKVAGTSKSYGANGLTVSNITYGDMNYGKGMSIGSLSNDIQHSMNESMRPNLVYNFGDNVATDLFVEYYEPKIVAKKSVNMISGVARYSRLENAISKFSAEMRSANDFPIDFNLLNSNSDDYKMSQKTFNKSSIYTKTKGLHCGMDLKALQGTIAYSLFPGKVSEVFENTRTEITKKEYEDGTKDKDEELYYKKIDGKYYKDSGTAYGNGLVIDVGYYFENTFNSIDIMYRTGHYENKLNYDVGNQISNGMVLGGISDTGRSDNGFYHQHTDLYLKQGSSVAVKSWMSYMGYSDVIIRNLGARDYIDVNQLLRNRYGKNGGFF